MIIELCYKDPKVITASLLVYSEIPLEKGGSRLVKISAKKRRIIDKLFYRINDSFYKSTEKDLNILPREKVIKKRLSQKFNLFLNSIELILIQNALEFYIKHSLLGSDRNCLGVYHGGFEYQIDLDDFIALYHRLFPENSKDELD